MPILNKLIEFEWDRGNSGKNWIRHRVNDQECEEVFFDNDKKVIRDASHSGQEERHILLGETKQRRLLFIVFTARGGKVRVISARDINKKESKLYYE